MGMFGSKAAGQGYADLGMPEPSLGAKLLNMVGENVLGVNYLGMKRRDEAERQQSDFMSQLTKMALPQMNPATPATPGMQGPGADGDPIGRTSPGAPATMTPGLSINDPRMAPIAIAAQRKGIPLATFLDVLKAQQPHMVATSDGRYVNDKDAATGDLRVANRQNVNGWITDLNNAKNEGAYLPKLPDGVIPDGRGGVGNPSGLTTALQAMEQAKQTGQTMGTVFNRPSPNGTTTPMLGRDMFGGGAAGPGGRGGAPGGAGSTQSPGDKTYMEAGANTAAAQYKAIADTGSQANAKIAGFKQIDRLLGNFEGGKLAPTGLDLASAANSIGFRMDPKMQNAQAADAISKQLVLSLSGGSLGTGFSNADRTFMEAQVPSLQQSAGGRRQLVSIGIATAQRQQDVAGKARAWQDRFGRIDAPDVHGKHFQDYLDAWSEAHPVFAPRR